MGRKVVTNVPTLVYQLKSYLKGIYRLEGKKSTEINLRVWRHDRCYS